MLPLLHDRHCDLTHPPSLLRLVCFAITSIARDSRGHSTSWSVSYVHAHSCAGSAIPQVCGTCGSWQVASLEARLGLPPSAASVAAHVVGGGVQQPQASGFNSGRSLTFGGRPGTASGAGLGGMGQGVGLGGGGTLLERVARLERRADGSDAVTMKQQVPVSFVMLG